MRFLIAPDAYKGTLTSIEAAASIAAGIRKALPDAELLELPLADGGEGTMELLHRYLGGEIRSTDLSDGRAAPCLFIEDTVYIESATLVGLHQPAMRALPVEKRGSGMLGELLHHLIRQGSRDFVIGLGGSAVNDGGLGMLMALGLVATDASGNAVTPDLAGLASIADVDATAASRSVRDHCRFTVLSDITAPLCGAQGATFVYGPQKGLSSAELEQYDEAMRHYAALCESAFGIAVSDLAGAGAAGGLGFALLLLGGHIVSGARYMIDVSGFCEYLERTDWVLTGEGCSDIQTLAGKLPLIVAQLTRQHGKRTAMLSGSVDPVALSPLSACADYVSGTADRLPDSSAEASMLLQASTERFARSLS